MGPATDVLLQCAEVLSVSTKEGIPEEKKQIETRWL